jgi:hypothetical protein
VFGTQTGVMRRHHGHTCNLQITVSRATALQSHC